MRIHGIIYIFIGLLFSVWSLALNIKNDYHKMTLFIVLGVVLILIGIIRILSK